MRVFSYLKYFINRSLFKLLNPKMIKNCDLDKSSKIGSGSYILYSSIGKYSYTGENCMISHSKIGKYCSIASDCIIGGASHPVDWISTSPVFIKGRNTFKVNLAKNSYIPYKETIIGNDVWIGNRAIIKSGVTIGDGAIIGMGSIITHNVNPYAIVAGNAGKLIRYRFDEDIIQELLKIKWWELKEKELSEIGDIIPYTEDFIKNFKPNK